MGVLDDAIREHLELKRQHGARDAEIKELEDEAFGPPSRPGEPDFPARETGEEAAAVATDAPPEALAGAETAVEHELVPPPPEHDVAPPPEPEEEEATQLMDAAAEPVAEAPPAAIEEAPPEEPDPERNITGSRGFYDQQADEAPEDDLGVEDLDLNLDETDEVVAAPEPPPAPEAEEAAPLPAEPEEPEADPLSTVGMPTEEHPFEDEVVDEIVVEEVEVEPDSVELELEEESGELTLEPDTGTGEDDVLEETPEFLREKPEDEELWFEQGEPQDFDFEDEDEEK